MTKSALMYCRRSEEDRSQWRRVTELARRMSEAFEVTILGERVTRDDQASLPNVRFVELPALGEDADSLQVDGDQSDESRNLIIARRDAMLKEFESLKPRVVIIEKFPFSQYRLRGEILPLIERARNGIYGESLVVCMTDSIMLKGSREDEARADRAAALLDKYFDIVVVNSDPVFARLEEFFQPSDAVNTPLYHTGFVMPGTAATDYSRKSVDDRVLVSAGDGRSGGALFRAAIEAHKILWPTLPVQMKIILGERLPEKDFRSILEMADDCPNLTLEQSASDIRREIAESRWSVCQCDYELVVSAIASGTPSLFVPAPDSRRDKQTIRAQRLAYWGVGRLLMPHHLNGASLANEIHQLTRFEPRQNSFDLDGAANTAHLLSQVVYRNDYTPVSSRPSGDMWRAH